MKYLKRILAFTLVLLMLSFACISCAKDEGESRDSVETTTTVVADGSRFDANGYIMSDLPIDELDYDGREVTVLARIYSEMSEPIYSQLDSNMDIVDQSVVNSVLKVNSDLNVNLTLLPYQGTNMKGDVEANVMSGTAEYQIFSTDFRNQGHYMLSNLLYDFNSIEGSYIDFEKPWWPDELVGDMMVNDSIYMLGGDISKSYLYGIWAMFYNIDMAEVYKITSPTELVMSGKWTLEKFMELSRDIRDDVDGEDPASGSWGYTCAGYDLDAFWFGSGFNCFVWGDTEEKVILDPQYFSEKADSLVGKMADFLAESDVYCELDNAGHYADDTRRDRPAFNRGGALFHTDTLTNAKHLNVSDSTDFKWGVLPMPKYDENQTEYLSTCRPGVNRMWSILSHVNEEDALMLTAVLEDFGSEAYRQITPAVFEICMKLRYSQDEINSKMFDYIRQHVVFDLGQSTSESFGGAFIFQLPGKAMMHDLKWKTRGAIMAPQISNMVDKVFNEPLLKEG